MNFTVSEKAKALIPRLRAFLEQQILPLELELIQESRATGADWNQWSLHPALEDLKTKARASGLWNLFLPDWSGLSHLDYAHLAEITGYSLLAPEIFNCNAPDTGNMELLHMYGSEQQQARWLATLKAGAIRSAFCMTEPEVASSDATNMQATIRQEGDHVILQGKKWWSTGIGHPACAFVIFMGLSEPDAPKHKRHSMVLVPLDTPGVTIQRMLPVFGTFDPPYGHGEVHFEQVRLPKSAVIGGLGRGFEIAQGRLGPGRVHHCMRLIGAAERALQLMCRRALAREAFGRPLAKLNANPDIIANARMELEMARLLVLKTAWLLDTQGIFGAISEVSQIKVVVPNLACRIIDQAMQMHGGAGLSDDTPLASLYTYARALRLADGPDEVHRALVARFELNQYR